MMYSVIKCENSIITLEFGCAFLKANINNFSYIPKENDLVTWKNGKFVKSELATEQLKQYYFLRIQNLSKKQK